MQERRHDSQYRPAPWWLVLLAVIATVFVLWAIALPERAEAQVTDPHLITTVAGLPTCNAGRDARIAAVTDSTSATACTAGGGGNPVLCQCNNGTGWVAIGSGGGISFPYDAANGDVTFNNVEDFNINFEATPGALTLSDSTSSGLHEHFKVSRDGVKRVSIFSTNTLHEVGISFLASDGTTELVKINPDDTDSFIYFADLAGFVGCGTDQSYCMLGTQESGSALVIGTNGGNIEVSDTGGTNEACLAVDSGRVFGNTDCDIPPVKDGGENYLDLSGSSGNSFETIDAPAGTDPVADSSTDTLALTAADGLSITGNSGTDTVAFGLTLAGDVDGSGSSNDIDETAVESELEGVMDLQDMQGAVTDGQVPNTLTLDLPGSTLTSMADDKVLVGTGVGTSSYVTISNCDDTTEKLDWNGTAFNCQTDGGGGGGGDNITVNATAATDLKFVDGDIDWTIATGPTPDELTATVACSGCVDVTDIGADAVGASEIATSGVDLASSDVTGTLPQANGGTGATVTWTNAMKLTDTSTASDATINDDDTMFFAMAANTKYAFRGAFVYTTNATADMKFRINGPASPTNVSYWLDCQLSSGACTDILVSQNSYPAETAVGTTATFGQFWFFGTVTNGANTGNFVFQWSQNTSDVGATVGKAGSYLEWRIAQ